MGEPSHVPQFSSIERIESCIYWIRGQKVMLDRDLAELYDVPTKALNQAVKRNRARFPGDFMFRLSWEESRAWRSHIIGPRLRSQPVTLKRGHHIKFRPYAFTEHGILMLSSVLNSERADKVNIEIMRAFVRLRNLLISHHDLARRLDELEERYDVQFGVVFKAIRRLMAPARRARRQIGFQP